MFDLENEGKGHRVQHSQWYHSMANINLCKSHMMNFISLALTVFEILTFQFVTLKMYVKVTKNNIGNDAIRRSHEEYLPL